MKFICWLFGHKWTPRLPRAIEATFRETGRVELAACARCEKQQ